jgi:DUSP domain
MADEGATNLSPISNMGTKNLNSLLAPTVLCSTSLEDLYKEFKHYKLLKKKDEISSNEPAGTPAYLVSIKWLNSYLRFILYR